VIGQVLIKGREIFGIPGHGTVHQHFFLISVDEGNALDIPKRQKLALIDKEHLTLLAGLHHGFLNGGESLGDFFAVGQDQRAAVLGVVGDRAKQGEPQQDNQR
jgi:hypothetical protein